MPLLVSPPASDHCRYGADGDSGVLRVEADGVPDRKTYGDTDMQFIAIDTDGTNMATADAITRAHAVMAFRHGLLILHRLDISHTSGKSTIPGNRCIPYIYSL